jgi:hypothetical protein
MKHLRLTPTALSVLETDVLDRENGDEDDGYNVIRLSFDGTSLVVDYSNSDAMARALTDLSNDCDVIGNGKELDSDERKFYRRAASAFGTLASAARKAGR